ncbi:MAG: ABC transporter ATP-binding protein [Clostridia bacterium]|nr:ABC transporter ATP-binding protein [Clostridia bacterium]
MKSKANLRRIFRYIGRYTPLLLISLLLAALSVGATLYIPILVGQAIDRMIGVGAVLFDEIWALLTQIVILLAASALAQWLMNVIHNRIAFQVVRDVRCDAFEKIQTLPLSYLDSHKVGDILSRVVTDAEQFADGLLLGFAQLFTGAITIVGTLVFMFVLQPWIALAVVVISPLSLFVAKFITTKTHLLFLAQSKLRAEQTAFVDEMIGNGKVVRAFAHEDEAQADFERINSDLTETSLNATFFSSLTNPSTRFVNSLVYAAIGCFGAFFVMWSGGAFTVGALSGFLSYAGQYTKPFNEISGVITELQNAFTCVGRVFELLDTPSEVSDADALALSERAKGSVALENVSFAYDPSRPLLQNISLSVEAGQRIAIVGPTGCGKTTLINLLMRYYDVDEGRITVDGRDIRSITRHSLRENYGMVLQETWLSSGTVRDNIRMGRPDATDEEVENAARAAHAHGFIRRLPKGYDTVLGENGGGLSGGQKQLLCIARVMLCLPPMLILDEATSSIDTRTEIKIQMAFSEMMKGRTSFIVAHRLSTIKEADVILVMKDGNIIEKGSHEALLREDGFYARLYHSQFEA